VRNLRIADASVIPVIPDCRILPIYTKWSLTKSSLAAIQNRPVHIIIGMKGHLPGVLRIQPNINLNFFGNDLDILAMREGVRWTYDLLTKGGSVK
jgi:hypothetical protein